MFRLLELILYITINAFNADITYIDNKIILEDFLINNFDIKTFVLKDNNFQLLAYRYNTNYNIIAKMDVNGNNIYETVTYSEHRKPPIQVIYNDKAILNISYDDLGIHFNGMSNGLYYMDIAKDKYGKYYFHSMCSNGSGKYSWIREEKYLTVQNNKLIPVDEVIYGLAEDYIHDVEINGIKAKDLKPLEDKYEIIEHDNFLLIYPYY